jgi:(1->4)-alpha-D-glucan 1-alpha-D-glucosylmutase
MKLFLIWRALDLRARRPDAFAGAYEPVDAGPGVCAFVRGGEVLVVVPVRDWEGAWLRGVPPGRWRDALTGAERDLAAEVTADELVEPYGLALLERV